jgi:hypothetical protein
MRLTVQKVRYYLKNNQAKWAGSNPNDAKCKQIVTEVFSNLRKVIKKVLKTNSTHGRLLQGMLQTS